MTDDQQAGRSEGDEPNDVPNPFLSGLPGLPAGFDFNALMGMLGQSGPMNWDVARQFAAWVAIGDDTTPPLTSMTALPRDPAIDASLERSLVSLAEAARTHAASVTGISEVLGAPIRVVGRRTWAELHLDALKPVLETLATTLNSALQPPDLSALTGPEFNPFAALMPTLGPLLLGMQAGSMIGALARHALGRYDLPLPTSDTPTMVFCAPNLEQFISDWSLSADDTRFHVALFEAVRVATRTVPWVQDRLVRLAREYVAGYEVDATRLGEAIGGFDQDALMNDVFNNPEAAEAAMAGLEAEPEVILSALRTPGQLATLETMQAFYAVLEGYVDIASATIGQPMLSTFHQIEEARRRHRLERGDADRMIEGLLGLELNREHYERGEAFCAGVVERAGIEGLNQLWEGEHQLPTSAELDAPGLWLARLELDLPR